MAEQKEKATLDMTDAATPEDKAKAKAREEAKKARGAAKNRIREFMGTLKDDDQLKADLLLVVGKAGGTRRAAGPSINQKLRDLLLEKKELSEFDIFKNFKIGRPEMTTKIRILLRTQNPEDRVWVVFDADKEVYRVVGTGANAPKGWDGYDPNTAAGL